MTSAIAANLETCALGKCAQPAEVEHKHALVDDEGTIFAVVELGYCLACYTKEFME